MQRSILLFLSGALAGVGAYVFVLDDADRGTVGPLPRAAVSDVAATPREDALPVGAQLGAWRAAADVDAADELETQLARALAAPGARQAEIDALFARLAALDARRAARVRGLRAADEHLIEDLFRAWAEQDPDAALLELGFVGSPANRTAAALALLEVLGNDTANITRVSAALPRGQQIDFVARALAQRAETDPYEALDAALALAEPAARSTAAQRVGMAWSHADPLAAFTRAASLPPEFRDAYRDSVIIEWAQLDAAGFLQFLETQPRLDNLLLGLGRTIAQDPAAVFELAGRKPSAPYYNFGTIERVAFSNLAQVDFEAARALAADFPYDNRGRQLTDALAEAYARAAPDEALAWARRFDPPRPGLEASVIALAAIADLDSGLRLLRNFNPPADHPAVRGGIATPEAIATTIGTELAASPRRTDIANDLLRRSDDPRAALVLQRITTQWVQIDPSSALDWMLEHETTIDRSLVANIGARLAARDARAAAVYAERIPAELRSTWFEAIAVPYAQQDPQNAAAWIRQFQGEERYDDVMRQVVAAVAQTDPRGAAATLAAAPAELQRAVVPRIASAWAAQNLADAARWAVGLTDAAARSAAVGTVASSWANRDPAAAQRWAANLPTGEARDRALAGVLARILQSGGELERPFMDAFASDAERERQVVSGLRALASRDPEEAELALRTWVRSPELRSEGERQIAEGRVSPGRLVLSSP